MLGDIREEVKDGFDDDLGVIFDRQKIQNETMGSSDDLVVEIDFFEKLSNDVMLLNEFDELFITT